MQDGLLSLASRVQDGLLSFGTKAGQDIERTQTAKHVIISSDYNFRTERLPRPVRNPPNRYETTANTPIPSRRFDFNAYAEKQAKMVNKLQYRIYLILFRLQD